jgi:hypothetical protein
MSQKSSLLQLARSVSRMLTADTHQLGLRRDSALLWRHTHRPHQTAAALEQDFHGRVRCRSGAWVCLGRSRRCPTASRHAMLRRVSGWNPLHFRTRRRTRRARRTWKAVGNLFFCVGIVILPGIAAADFTAWLACRNASGACNLEMICAALIQANIAELGVIDMADPIRVR